MLESYLAIPQRASFSAATVIAIRRSTIRKVSPASGKQNDKQCLIDILRQIGMRCCNKVTHAQIGLAVCDSSPSESIMVEAVLYLN